MVAWHHCLLRSVFRIVAFEHAAGSSLERWTKSGFGSVTTKHQMESHRTNSATMTRPWIRNSLWELSRRPVSFTRTSWAARQMQRAWPWNSLRLITVQVSCGMFHTHTHVVLPQIATGSMEPPGVGISCVLSQSLPTITIDAVDSVTVCAKMWPFSSRSPVQGKACCWRLQYVYPY